MTKPILSVSDFQRLLKKDLHGAFLFFGQEAYLKEHCLRALREKVLQDDALSPFNHIRLQEENATPLALAQAIETPPMMAEQKLIEVHSVPLATLSEKDWEEWEMALEGADAPDTVVLFYAESEELPTEKGWENAKEIQRLCEVLQGVHFPTQSRMQLAKWIVRHLQEAQISCTPDFPDALLDFCGSDMHALGNEIQKIVGYLHFHGRTEAQKPLIAQLCASHPARDPFDFTNAILDGNTQKAFALFADMKAKKERPEIILGSISRVICDLSKIKIYTDAGRNQAEIAKLMKAHAYRVGLYQKQAQKRSGAALRRAVLLCADADQKMKNSFCDPYLVLERLIVELGQAGARPLPLR